ncbi:MAG: hypothetical protein V4616_03250 [Bacteroidota bacterium]
MRTSIFIACSLLVLASCKKEKAGEEDSDGFSDIPAIEVVSVNKTTIKEFQDSVVIVISYKDRNGDLGRQDPDDNSLYIKDRRLPDADYYHIPPITPADVNLKTRGTIRIVYPNLFLLGNGSNETTQLYVKIKDQAGNWSNELEVGPFTVTK